MYMTNRFSTKVSRINNEKKMISLINGVRKTGLPHAKKKKNMKSLILHYTQKSIQNCQN